MPWSGELAAGGLDDDAHGGTEAQSGHGRELGADGILVDELLELHGDLLPLGEHQRQLLGQVRKDERARVGARYHDRLLNQGRHDVVGEAVAEARSSPSQSRREAGATGRTHYLRRGVALKQVERRRVLQPRPQDPLQRRVDLHQQAPDAVRHLVNLRGEVLVEAGQHRHRSAELAVLPRDVGQRPAGDTPLTDLDV